VLPGTHTPVLATPASTLTAKLALSTCAHLTRAVLAWVCAPSSTASTSADATQDTPTTAAPVSEICVHPTRVAPTALALWSMVCIDATAITDILTMEIPASETYAHPTPAVPALAPW